MSINLDDSINQRFKSRIGMLLCALGVAVGTGNIWRFPRIVAQSGDENGAGAFLIAWIIFLFLWSIPLIIAEYALGKKYRKSVIGSFASAMGSKFSWMGGFVSLVTVLISFFYAVIVGWCIFYFGYFLINPLPQTTEQAIAIWEKLSSSNWAYLSHFIAVGGGILAIWKGISSIEKVNKVLIPTLLIIIFLSVIRSLFLPSSIDGISYIFNFDFSLLAKSETWLNALTQNAWDTGAGWGLFMAYAVYMKKEEKIVKNAALTAMGNNFISLLAAIMIFGTVFSVLSTEMNMNKHEILEIIKTSGPASTGLTFIWLPQLFNKMFMGSTLAVFFFLGLMFAGFSSLIAMLELPTRVFIESGISRKKSLSIVFFISLLLGIPSVTNINFLLNQDFVWGIGLIISGAFVAFATMKHGLEKLLEEEIASIQTDLNPGKLWIFTIKYLVPFAAFVLLLWWLGLSVTQFSKEQWFNPFDTYSLMTCLVQWGIALIILIIFNKFINKKLRIN